MVFLSSGVAVDTEFANGGTPFFKPPAFAKAVTVLPAVCPPHVRRSAIDFTQVPYKLPTPLRSANVNSHASFKGAG